MEQTQELERKHKEAIEAQAAEHASKINEAVDAAETAEATKIELEGEVHALKANITANGREILALKEDAEKATHTSAELQTAVSAKSQELTKANDTIEDHKMKLIALEKSLDEARKREKI